MSVIHMGSQSGMPVMSVPAVNRFDTIHSSIISRVTLNESVAGPYHWYRPQTFQNTQIWIVKVAASKHLISILVKIGQTLTIQVGNSMWKFKMKEISLRPLGGATSTRDLLQCSFCPQYGKKGSIHLYNTLLLILCLQMRKVSMNLVQWSRFNVSCKKRQSCQNYFACFMTACLTVLKLYPARTTTF